MTNTVDFCNDDSQSEQSNPNSRTTRFDHAIVRLGVVDLEVSLGPAGSTHSSFIRFVEFPESFPDEYLTQVAVILTNRSAPTIVADATVNRLEGRQGFWLRVSNSVPMTSSRDETQATFSGVLSFSWLAVVANNEPHELSNGSEFDIRSGLIDPQPLAKFAAHDWPAYPKLFGDAFHEYEEPLLFMTPTHGDGFDGPNGDHVSAVNRAVSNDHLGITELKTWNADSCPGYATFFWVAIARRTRTEAGEENTSRDWAINSGVSQVPNQFARTAMYNDWQNLHRRYDPAFAEPPHTLVTGSGAGATGHQSSIVGLAFHQERDCGNVKGRSCDPHAGQSGFHWVAFGRLAADTIQENGNASTLSQLCIAAGNNDFTTARKILAADRNVLKSDPVVDPEEGKAAPYKDLGVGESPLMRAVDSSHLEMVRLLLQYGADPDEHHGYNYGMPLQTAVCKWRFDIAHLLLDHGADPAKSTAMADMEATGYSLLTGNVDLINRMYAAGGRADIFAYIKANMLPVLGELLDHCPDVPANNPSVAGARTILEAIRGEASWCGNADALAMALAVQPITEAQFKNHVSSAIHSHNRLFSVESYLRCFGLLLDAGADYIYDADFCPIHQLARKNNIEGRIEFAKLFVERGTDPNKPHFKSGETALQEAREYDRSDLIAYLESL